MSVKTGSLDKPVYILNATDSDSLVVEIPAKAEVAAFDTYGAEKGTRTYEAGCHRMAVPPSGYLLVK